LLRLFESSIRIIEHHKSVSSKIACIDPVPSEFRLIEATTTEAKKLENGQQKESIHRESVLLPMWGINWLRSKGGVSYLKTTDMVVANRVLVDDTNNEDYVWK